MIAGTARVGGRKNTGVAPRQRLADASANFYDPGLSFTDRVRAQAPVGVQIPGAGHFAWILSVPTGSNGLGAEFSPSATASGELGHGLVRLDPPAGANAGLSLCQRAGLPVREAVARGTFAGVVTGVLLADGAAQVEAYGQANREAAEVVTPDTLFWIASLTKSMTSTLVMMLVDEGKLGLDDPVERYVPKFRGQTVPGWFGRGTRPRRPATIADLMRHLSGMPAEFPFEKRPLDRLTLAEKAELCGSLRLAAQPGERHLYSNLNYETLGHLVEVASGSSFEAFLQERLLDPLGMRETTFRPCASQFGRLALPYASENGSLARRSFALVSEPFDDAGRQPTPAFGLFSTADDCLRFCRLHLQGGEWQGRRLFSTESAKQLLRRFESPPGVEFQGLAWSVSAGAACMTGMYGTWMTLHLRLGMASVFLSASADFWEGPRDVCKRFVGNVGAELRAERAAERRRVAAERRNLLRRGRRVRRPIDG